MRAIEYQEPSSLEEAVALLGEDGHVRLLAGGSDLLGELKEGIAPYNRLVSLGGIAGLDRIERHAGRLHIGAMVTLSALEAGAGLEGPYRMLAEAARSVATPEVRNQATLGGNLCQRPRCLYYRNALTPCLKKGGASCPAVESPFQMYLSAMGGHGCYAVNPSDLAPPLIALDAVAVIEGRSGRREVALQDFFIAPELDPARETCLAPDEVLVEVVLPALPEGWRGLYSKGRERTAGDFAIVSLALGYELADGRMHSVRVVFGSLATRPWRCREAEAVLEGQPPSEGIAAQAADAALANARPLEHNAYKLDLARALLLRAVARLTAGLV